MRLKHIRTLAAAGLGTLLLTGCGGLDPVQPDQDVVLPAGDGVAVVVLDTLDPVNAIYLKSPDDQKAPTIEIDHVLVGITYFAYVVPAGSYCLTRYSIGNYYMTQDRPKDGTCFDVLAGKIAYSGNLSPRGLNGKIVVYQNYDWPAFQKSFKEKYPKLASVPIVTP